MDMVTGIKLHMVVEGKFDHDEHVRLSLLLKGKVVSVQDTSFRESTRKLPARSEFWFTTLEDPGSLISVFLEHNPELKVTFSDQSQSVEESHASK